MASVASDVAASQDCCTFVHLLSTLIFKYIKFTGNSPEAKVVRNAKGSRTLGSPYFFLLESESWCLQQRQATFSCCCCDAVLTYAGIYIVGKCAT